MAFQVDGCPSTISGIGVSEPKSETDNINVKDKWKKGNIFSVTPAAYMAENPVIQPYNSIFTHQKDC